MTAHSPATTRSQGRYGVAGTPLCWTQPRDPAPRCIEVSTASRTAVVVTTPHSFYTGDRGPPRGYQRMGSVRRCQADLTETTAAAHPLTRKSGRGYVDVSDSKLNASALRRSVRSRLLVPAQRDQPYPRIPRIELPKVRLQTRRDFRWATRLVGPRVTGLLDLVGRRRSAGRSQRCPGQ